MATRALAAIALLSLAACTAGGFSPVGDQVYAPGVKPGAEAVDGLTVGHRLMEAGEYELALEAFTRAAATHGMTAEVLSGLGSANLGLARLGQAERQLRDAVETGDAMPEAWNNLGIVLMEKGETAEAEQMFRRAYALDNGESDAIRDNLRLAIEKRENSVYDEPSEDQQDYKLVRRGRSSYTIQPIP